MHPLDRTSLDELTSFALQVFNDVLGLEGIAENDDFFDDCGGTSLQAWGVIVGIEDGLNVDVDFREFLVARTARGTAELLSHAATLNPPNH